jgi:hypothetical protein
MREQVGYMVETWKWLLKDDEKEPGILLMETEVLESIAPPKTTQ